MRCVQTFDWWCTCIEYYQELWFPTLKIWNLEMI